MGTGASLSLTEELNRPDFDGPLHRLEEDGVMAEHGSSPFQRRYPPELRERAVRMVLETASERGERFGVVDRRYLRSDRGPRSEGAATESARRVRSTMGGVGARSPLRNASNLCANAGR
jgi:transposase-like protein